jgi:hypothetical protein
MGQGGTAYALNRMHFNNADGSQDGILSGRPKMGAGPVSVHNGAPFGDIDAGGAHALSNLAKSRSFTSPSSDARKPSVSYVGIRWKR